MPQLGVELPTFKGTPGWEFTPIDKLDLAALPAAPAGTGTAGVALLAPEGGVGPSEEEPGTSDPSALIVAPLRVALERHAEVVGRHFGTVVRPSYFATVNADQWTDGTLVYVPRNVKVEAPIVITTVQDRPGTSLHHRTLVVLEEGAEAEVWDQVASSHDEEALVNGVVELVVGDNATLRYFGAQTVNEKTWVFGSQRAVLGKDAELDWTTLGFGGSNGKVFLETTLAGRGSTAKVTGAYATRGRQHIDYDTLQEHAAADTVSDLAFRGLVSGRSTAVWRGMIKVDPGAQRTDAFQEARNLLIGNKAHADAIPGLEILADDVRCTHAAAIAQIDPEQIFYLRSRGLERPVAERLVVEGFLGAVVERYAEGPIRDTLAGAIDARLATVLG
ncbi:Fe-S cluster assembly protein SufD [Baekduia soli]|uniref:Fe-S cluster assembly protein SufD n=1 Tax=Baekduia soli TaxID=496014 RepID=UPI0016523692|nr:Fe-S cluster assembly protein SufD [Baekduia soli]